MRILAKILLALAVLAGGCSEFEGPIPPGDALYFPVSVLAHPNGEVLYIVNSNFDAQYRTDVGGTVVVVDTETFEILSETTVQIGSFGGGLALNDAGGTSPDKLFVAVRGDDSVVVLSVSPDGRTIDCDGSGDALACRVRGVPSDPFSVVSLPHPFDSDGNELEDVELVATASIDGGVAYITIDGGRYEDATMESRGVLSGASVARYFAPSDQLWIGARFSRRLQGLRHIFEPNTRGEVVEFLVETQTLVPTTFDSAEVRDMVFSNDMQRAYVTSNRPSAVLVLDMSLDDNGEPRAAAVDRFDLDGAPAELAVADEGGREVLYIAQSNDEAVAVVDAETGILLDSISLGGLAFALEHDPIGNLVYVAIFDEHEVVAIDTDPTSATFRQLVGRIR
ncbi:MAG: DNA-binding beta-propeller fold protein YncE [Bradymonadia bacterium]|jgi:DNA-binding beta-propeller fold protein YncE